jgi:hypothetical protein
VAGEDIFSWRGGVSAGSMATPCDAGSGLLSAVKDWQGLSAGVLGFGGAAFAPGQGASNGCSRCVHSTAAQRSAEQDLQLVYVLGPIYTLWLVLSEVNRDVA